LEELLKPASLCHWTTNKAVKKRRWYRQLFANEYSNEELQDNINGILLMLL